MNKFFKEMTRIKLLGLIVWGIPFLVSVLVWDAKINAPSISGPWFNGLMGLSLAVGFSIAALKLFRKETKKTVQKTAMLAGFTWYLQLVSMDLLVLVLLFGMPITDWYPMILVYSSIPVLTIAIGGMLAKR